MKKLLTVLLAMTIIFSLSGCAFAEFLENEKNAVDLGDGEEYVKWHLVENDNEYSAVESAYFEFCKDSFRYYENGELKREGEVRINYYGVENLINPLQITLYLGDDDGFSVFDYLQCYTEDSRDGLHQFTIMSQGYHIKPLRSGGVPVRDYHLSEMPYAMGTYVKESTERYDYENGKADYLGCSRLDGHFVDGAGNEFYFLNNSYSSKADSVSYTVYMHYETADGEVVEGTIFLSWYEDFYTGERHDVALIYVTHGDGEPGKESGTSAEADFELMDFIFTEDGSISFARAEYFADEPECDILPSVFIGGAYVKVENG